MSRTAKAVLPIVFACLGFVVGACEEGQIQTTSPTAPPAPPQPDPPPPPVLVSFVEESIRVTEGETIEIPVALSGGDVRRPFRIQIAAEEDSVVDADYVLVTPVLEIRPSGASGTTTTIVFRALDDEQFAEGDETLWLRLEVVGESSVEVGPRLAVTIDDAGVSPCTGIRVRVEPPTELSSGAFQTQLTLVSDIRSGAVAADWIGPYADHRGQALGRVFQNQFNVLVKDWSFWMEGATSHQQITFEWNPEEVFGLRFRSSDVTCAGQPTLACSGDSCEMRH